jgi:hypothetical protein
MISRSDIKMPRLVAELHAQFARLLSHWERPGEGACISAKLEQAIKANLRGLGYGG